MNLKEFIESDRAVLGIELGSTRIKAVLIDENHAPIATGSHEWENQLVDGFWTYSMEDTWKGLQDSYRDLKRDVLEKYGARLTRLAALGMSAMMHGYLPFDKEDRQLARFRTWRNTTTGEAAGKLTKLFKFNIPQRWSVAHLYQAILNGEEHVRDIAHLTTLAGYVHWKLTGKKLMGVGEASGMFPIDSETGDYDQRMLNEFDNLVQAQGYPWKLRDILPQVLSAGENAGVLTEEGALLLDPTGEMEAGIPMCPPEGDAGTGMTATNSVAMRTGNVSAGTSVFAMVVLERGLKRLHEEIDMVTTPAGKPVAMVHCNNCTTDLNAWVSLFGEFAREIGCEVDADTLFGTLYRKALEGDKDCGKVLTFNFFSGEHIVGFEEGRPLVARTPESRFTLANFMRANLYTAVGVIKIGMEILIGEEKVKIDNIYGHGGFFKTKGVGQSVLAAAINAPVSVMETAGEGGAWGIALLAKYMVSRKPGQALEDYLSDEVFKGSLGEKMEPNPDDVKGFDAFIELYKAALPVERAAIENIR